MGCKCFGNVLRKCWTPNKMQNLCPRSTIFQPKAKYLQNRCSLNKYFALGANILLRGQMFCNLLGVQTICKPCAKHLEHIAANVYKGFGVFKKQEKIGGPRTHAKSFKGAGVGAGVGAGLGNPSHTGTVRKLALELSGSSPPCEHAQRNEQTHTRVTPLRSIVLLST